MEIDTKDNKRRQRSLDLLKKARERKLTQQPTKDSELITPIKQLEPYIKTTVPVVSPNEILDKLESVSSTDNMDEEYLIITDENGSFSRFGFQINIWYKLHFSGCKHNNSYIPKKSYDARNIQTYLLSDIGTVLPVINVDHIKSHCNICLQDYIKHYQYTLLSLEIVDSNNQNDIKLNCEGKHGIITVPSHITEQHQFCLMDLWLENNLGYIPIVRISEAVISVLKMIPSWLVGDLTYVLSLPIGHCDEVTDVDNDDLDGLVDTMSESDTSIKQQHLTEIIEETEKEENSQVYTNTDWTLDMPDELVVKLFCDGGAYFSDLKIISQKSQEIVLLKYLVQAGFKYWKDIMMKFPNKWCKFPSNNDSGLKCDTLGLAIQDWGIRSDELFYNLIPILSNIAKNENLDIGLRIEKAASIFLCIYSRSGQ